MLRRPKTVRPDRGFALVIALGLMGFILLLLVSLTSLLRVETQSAAINLATLKARQNALLGAMVAVGELQEHAGPDQRVTSDTDYIFGDAILVESADPPPPDPNDPPDPDDPAVTLEVTQRRWTGVWKPQTLGGYKTPQHIMWLVSGNEGVDPDDPAFQTTTDGTTQTTLFERPTYDNGILPEDNGTVWMVHEGTVGINDTTNYVQAPVVAFDDGAGAYAWWVGDEGSKAPLALDNPYAGDDLSYRVAQKPDFSDVSELGAAFENNSARTRISGLQELPLAGASDEAPKERFFDVTPLSMGVLADSNLGGLRKDLTRAFAPDNDAALDLIRQDLVDTGRPPATADYIFPPAGGVETADDPGGPRWEQLRDYYNLRPTSADTINLTASGTNVPTIKHRDDQLGVYPVLTWFQIRYYLTMTKDRVADPLSERNVRFWFLPTVALWNPYDTDLVIPELYVLVSTDINPGSGGRDNLRYKWQVLLGGKGGATVSGDNVGFFENNSSDDPLPLILTLESSLIPAGEARLFRPKGHQEITPSDQVRTGSVTVGQGNLLTSDLNAGDYHTGLWFINSRSGPSDATFPYDSDNEYYGEVFSPLSDNDMDMNIWISENPNFLTPQSDPGGGGSVIQQVNHVENSHPQLPRGFVMDINEDPYERQKLELLSTPPPFDSSASITYPLFANSMMLKWTNTWYPNPPPSGVIPPLRYPWMGLSNPRASFAGRSGYETDDAMDSLPGSAKVAKNPPIYNSHGSINGQLKNGANWDIEAMNNSDEVPYVGWDYLDGGAFLTKATAFAIPRSDDSILSIGQFMHANLSRTNGMDSGQNVNDEEWFRPGERHLYGNYTPAYPIGNGRADPRIPLEETSVDWNADVSGVGSVSGTHYDYSYLLNEALWDRYFITAIPESGAVPDPLPNARLVTNPFDRALTDADRRDFNRAAASYLVSGSFNVNSSSVEAWRALLSSFLGTTVSLSGGGSAAGRGSAFPRFNEPMEGEFAGAQDSSEAYNGFRRLTEQEIDELANAIVDEMKRAGGRRNPFLSVAQFVNRNVLEGDIKAKAKGILQAAIDSTSINREINNDTSASATNADGLMELADGDISETDGAPGYTQEAFDGVPYAANVAGYLSQADVMARIGSVLSARSDTFRIRSYGAVRDPLTGEETSRIWGEMWVQRLPEYVDDTVQAETAVADLAPNSANERFGRKFRILGFRWLPEEEI